MATETTKLAFVEGAAAATPAASRAVIYAKADGLMYSKDDAGVETLMSSGAASGGVATDAIWDAKGDLAGGTGANTAARLAVGTNGYHLQAQSGQATGLLWAKGNILKDFARSRRTSGNVTLNSTSWANVDTALDLTLDAIDGDWIEVGLSTSGASDAVNLGLDVATIVAAAPVTYASGSAGGAGAYGVQAWITFDSGHPQNIGGSVMFQLGAGDVSGGSVLLRLRYRTGTAANKDITASTNQPLEFWAKNLGQSL